MKLSIVWKDTSLSVAEVTEWRWWRPAVWYTVALYAERDWIRDDTNDYVGDRVSYELEMAKRRALGKRPP